MSTTLTAIRVDDKTTFYSELCLQLTALIDGEPDAIAQLANASALLAEHLEDINWVGFYLLKSGGLVVGTFQGRVACTRIATGRGVCGTAVARGRSIVVDDVEAFADHIACDSASRSEVVVPLRDRSGAIVGVLDVDSPLLARFDDEDRDGLERVAAVLALAVDFRAAGCDQAP